ncbi:MAG: hypothetical protein A3J83_07710 [Elusimicrobia bacterium RIFOXYA2_FULL_40_6]|nr:MAG: hypothetical protein A3J83_07710 [Elusimicrobia bacterium RIFOXYA2_FULL_40_6]
MKDSIVSFCVNCGNTTKHRLLHDCDDAEYVDVTEEYGPVCLEYHYYLTKCDTCNQVSLYCKMEFEEGSFDDWENATLVYPHKFYLPDFIPSSIRKTYNEANLIMIKSPNAYAGLIGKTLEYICEDKNAIGGTLNEKLLDLSNKGIIPPTLSDMTRTIRIIRNLGLHANDKDVGIEECRTIKKFIEIILEYVYIVPHNIEELQKKHTI